MPGSFIENCKFFKVFWNNWIPQFFDYDFFFFFFQRTKIGNSLILEYVKKGFFESGCSKIEFPFQLCPNLGFRLHKSNFISKSWMVHKSFAQMKSNNNLKGQRLGTYVTKKRHKNKHFVLLPCNPDEQKRQTHSLQAIALPVTWSTLNTFLSTSCAQIRKFLNAFKTSICWTHGSPEWSCSNIQTAIQGCQWTCHLIGSQGEGGPGQI